MSRAAEKFDDTQRESLPELLEQLRDSDLKHQAAEPLLQACLSIDDVPSNSFMFFFQAGELAIEYGHPELAEKLAIRSLKALPRYGAALRLLGRTMEVQGFQIESEQCHRYILPESIREKYFADSRAAWVELDKAFGARRIQAFPAEKIELSAPLQLHSQVVRELNARAINAPAAFTAQIDGGTIWFDTFNTTVWNVEGGVIEELCRGHTDVVQTSLSGKMPMRVAGRACLLGNRNSRNYYHWMNDILPKLAVLRASGFDLDDIDWFLINPLEHQFQKDTLLHFGIDETRLLHTDSVEHLAADEILIPVYGCNSLGLAQARWNPAFLAQEFAPKELPAAHRKLYVSRGSSGARGVANEEELIVYLQALNFEVVRCETLSIEEQAALFASASVVLGPHGAGFTNTAFCQPDTTVIELYGAHIEPCFWALSALTRCRHVVHHCGTREEHERAAENYHASHDERRNAPIYVDIEQIERILEMAQITG
ncbi:glycosyltransferase family 61 protein [Granulosicoccus antarcticus]|uniref:Glycosyltransferase 61 catalytic domain-containing protein n=1 Tax=Granulosicoccus antarcticus IMCC3135 TaxID=1192854 RepID=A0A2Z2NVD2_9GAMM|nr:glycosyltransferase family 61 protein [Granulosicoccus antarcticus]ASJ71617.1 hypothetical protein IMCC3135_07560 [Granulosicoccus antarcticus IMCC3135]